MYFEIGLHIGTPNVWEICIRFAVIDEQIVWFAYITPVNK